MKKKVLAVAVIVICLALVATGSLAYFTAEQKVHNVITSGGVTIELVEMTEGEDGALVEFPGEGISGVMPGAQVSKIVSVKNTGSGDAWIRVKVAESLVDAQKQPLPHTIGQDKTPVMSYSVEEEFWILAEDGYYYYRQPVAPGESTETLFETVRFAPEMGNEYQGCTANLVISAQAVQTANNGETVAEAVGWPEAPAPDETENTEALAPQWDEASAQE